LLVLTLPVHEAGRGLAHKSQRAAPAVPHLRRAPLKERPPESLLQADADEAGVTASGPARNSKARNNLLGQNQDKLRPPKDANWFASFDEAESTYDEDAAYGRAHLDDNNVGRVLTGWNPSVDNPYNPDVKDAEWFSETPSAGSTAAWQTHYPALKEGLAGHGATPGDWYQSATGHWQEEYVDAHTIKAKNWMEAFKAQTIPASWFDNSVSQYDGFGRRKKPDRDTGRFYYDWEERSVNTTLTCKDPGCVANVSLQAPFDASKEEAKFCRLSVFFHATDFDEQYSGEQVEYIEVNNNRVSSNCFPKASGCNATAGKPLYPCVQGVNVDMAMTSAGTMAIAAKIPNVVDECPYEGNMLSAVPMVTCLVTPIVTPTILSASPTKTVLVGDVIECKQQAPIRCKTRGCLAETVLPMGPVCGAPKNKCKLNMMVYQTDYDGDQGSSEMVEFVQVGGVDVKTKVKPGGNPCLELWSTDKNVTEAKVRPRDTYQVLKDQDVSENATSGAIRVSAKISDLVDECAYEGYLFSGEVEVDCGNVTVTPEQYAMLIEAEDPSVQRVHA